MKDKKQSIGKGFIILSAASVLVKVMSLVFVPVVRALLGGSAGYSVYSAAYSVYAFVYVLATAGFPVGISKLVTELTATKRVQEAERTFKIARTVMLLLGAVFTVLLAAFAKPIAAEMNNEESWLGILFIAPTLLVCSLLSAYRGYFQGKKNMIPTAASQVVEQVVHVIVSLLLVFALSKKGVVWAVAGATIGTAAGAFAALLIVLIQYRNYGAVVSRQIRAERRERRESGLKVKMSAGDILKRLFYYSIPITLSAGVQYAGDLLDNKMIIGRLTSGGFTREASKILHGDFMSMRQLINVPTALITALCVSILPAVVAAYAIKDKKAAAGKANYGFKLCYTVAFPMAAAMAAFAKPIYILLGFGDNYKLLMFMSFSVLLMGTMHLQSSIMQSVNRLFTSTIFLIFSVILKAVLNYFLIKTSLFNIYGAIVSTYISYMLPVILNSIVLKRKVKLNISLLQNAGPPALASALMLVCSFPLYCLFNWLTGKLCGIYISNSIAVLLAAVVGAAVYFVALRRMKALTDEDMDSISPKIRRYLGKLTRA